MITRRSLVCSLSEKEAVPAAAGFKARRSCCGLRQPDGEKAVSLFFFFAGKRGDFFASSGPKPAGLIPWYWQLRCHPQGSPCPPWGSASSQGSLCPCPAKDPSLYPFTESFAVVAVSLGVWRRANFKISCKFSDLFPSNSMTFSIFCSFQDYCALVPIYLFFFFFF